MSEDLKKWYSALTKTCSNCNKCSLSETRNKAVVARTMQDGRVNLLASLMVIGEAPGEEEDLAGLPFVGKSGEIVTLSLRALGLEEDTYITNVVKCRPPENKTPTKETILSCISYLTEEIQQVNPIMIITLGRTAMEAVTSSSFSTRETGPLFSNIGSFEGIGIPVCSLYHPSYFLRQLARAENKETVKMEYWNEWQKAAKLFDALKTFHSLSPEGKTI